MKSQPLRHQARQLSLFNPPPVLPTWERFPANARREVLQLLAEMLHRHRPRCSDIRAAREVTNE
jgi:hypothetical protein